MAERDEASASAELQIQSPTSQTSSCERRCAPPPPPPTAPPHTPPSPHHRCVCCSPRGPTPASSTCTSRRSPRCATSSSARAPSALSWRRRVATRSCSSMHPAPRAGVAARYGAAVDVAGAVLRRRSLAQSEKEAAAARAQLAEAGKKLRQAEVYRKGHEDSTKKLRKLTAEHERQGQEVIELRLSLSELTNAKQQLLDETARANDAVAAAERRAAAAEEGYAKAEKERTVWPRAPPRHAVRQGQARAAARAAAARQVRRRAPARCCARGRDCAAPSRARRAEGAGAPREGGARGRVARDGNAGKRAEEEMLRCSSLTCETIRRPTPRRRREPRSVGTAATRSGVGR